MMCLQCGAEFINNKNGTRKWCSKRCSDKSRAERKKLGPFVGTCYCGTTFTSAYSHQVYCSMDCYYEVVKRKGSERWARFNPQPDNWNYECDQCGIVVERSLEQGRVSKGKYGRFCASCTLERQRVRYRKKTTKRRGVAPSNVSVERLVEAHGAVCWLCKEPIDLALPRTSRMGATVDHVVPLSKGGSDEFENLMLAHWICNNRKSDKLVSNA